MIHLLFTCWLVSYTANRLQDSRLHKISPKMCNKLDGIYSHLPSVRILFLIQTFCPQMHETKLCCLLFS